MGLRCLLAHDFGATEVERERQEDGNEMVVTVREVQICERCGERKILSENKEVTAIRTPEELGLDDDTAGQASAGRGSEAAASPTGPSPTPPESSDPSPSTTTSTATDGPSVDDLAAAASDVDTAADATTTPADAGSVGAADVEGGAATDEPTSPDAGSERVDAGSEQVDAEATQPGAGAEQTGEARASPGPDGAVPGDTDTNPESEDTEILDESDDDRGHGEWPDAEVTAGESSEAADVGVGGGAALDGSDGHDGATVVDSDADADAEGEEPAESVDPEALAAEEDAEFIGGSTTGAGASTAPTDGADTDEADTGAGHTTASTGAETDDGDGEAASTSWPEHDGVDEGFAADGASGDGPGVSFGGGLTPQATHGSGESRNGTGNETTLDGNESGGYETSFADAERENRDGDGDILRAAGEGTRSPRPDANTEFFCPHCGHTRPTDASLRPGDICPECQRGYIAERER